MASELVRIGNVEYGGTPRSLQKLLLPAAFHFFFNSPTHSCSTSNLINATSCLIVTDFTSTLTTAPVGKRQIHWEGALLLRDERKVSPHYSFDYLILILDPVPLHSDYGTQTCQYRTSTMGTITEQGCKLFNSGKKCYRAENGHCPYGQFHQLNYSVKISLPV